MNRFNLNEEYDLISMRQRVSAIIIKDNKLVVGLFDRGSDGNDYYGLAGGGIDKEDENEEAAVVRETKEEFGISITIKTKLCTKIADYAEYYNGQENIPNSIDRTYGKDGFKTIFYLCDYKGTDKSLYGSEPDMAKVKLISIKAYYDYTKKRVEKYKKENSWLYFLLKQECEVFEEYILNKKNNLKEDTTTPSVNRYNINNNYIQSDTPEAPISNTNKYAKTKDPQLKYIPAGNEIYSKDDKATEIGNLSPKDIEPKEADKLYSDIANGNLITNQTEPGKFDLYRSLPTPKKKTPNFSSDQWKMLSDEPLTFAKPTLGKKIDNYIGDKAVKYGLWDGVSGANAGSQAGGGLLINKYKSPNYKKPEGYPPGNPDPKTYLTPEEADKEFDKQNEKK